MVLMVRAEVVRIRVLRLIRTVVVIMCTTGRNRNSRNNNNTFKGRTCDIRNSQPSGTKTEI